MLEKFVSRYGRLPTERDPDYLEMLQMSKYRVLDVPLGQPGKCSNCGASKNDGRKYVDFGLYIDWYGTVHICTLCLTDIAQNAGIFTELEEKLGLLMRERETIDSVKLQGVELHETVLKTHKEFEEYYGNLHSLRDSSFTDSSSVVEQETTDVEPGVVESDEGNTTPDSGSESSTTKSTSSSRRKNVRSLAELLNKPIS